MQGKIFINGQERTGLLSDGGGGQETLKVGMVFQSGALFDSLTVSSDLKIRNPDITSESPMNMLHILNANVCFTDSALSVIHICFHPCMRSQFSETLMRPNFPHHL